MILLQINVGCNSLGLISSKTFALDSTLLPLSPKHVHAYLTLLGKTRNHTLPASSAYLHSIPHFLCIIQPPSTSSLPSTLETEGLCLFAKRLKAYFPCVSLLSPLKAPPYSSASSSFQNHQSFSLPCLFSKSLESYSISHNFISSLSFTS